MTEARGAESLPDSLTNHLPGKRLPEETALKNAFPSKERQGEGAEEPSAFADLADPVLPPVPAEIFQRYSAPPPLEQGRRDEYYMTAALALAEYAASLGEVPVGCVIVRDGALLSVGWNSREREKNALAHAECAAIQRGCRAAGGWRLTRSTLYVTLEPCPMCAGAVWCARIDRVVVGAKDPKAGAMGSLLNLSSYPLNHRPSVEFGVLGGDCAQTLRRFFSSRRNTT